MNKTISIELAKRIDALCKEKGVVLPESEFVWSCEVFRTNTKEATLVAENIYQIRKKENANSKKNIYPAYDCSELGEILPWQIFPEKKPPYYLTERKRPKSVEEWLIVYERGDRGFVDVVADTEAEARGKLLLYLLSNSLLK